MTTLNDRIKRDGIVVNESILKIDSFLNHQIDPLVISQIAEKLYDHYKETGVTKILTIEASGIAPALMTAQQFEVPMLFAKKATPSTLLEEQYKTDIHSYTKNITNSVIVSKEYLSQNDVVLIVDDFLASGQAAMGLIDLVKQAGAKVAGVGICVEKSFQGGREELEKMDVDVYSISRIASLKSNEVTFVEEARHE
ncbi:MAG: xanthine phosphoribosyltransferase [Atopococcus tabaci]|uniref:Xanthine phosphoribosyltransferase n=1 Tax=Atopococcus tabaci TaxID=269774 RepID=A0AA43UC99_9LACT|nr:xanthine phosphoribosyltransferase [Atopococcus tabaci]